MSVTLGGQFGAGAGSSVEATESFTYTLDGKLDTRTDFEDNDWETIWHTCCGRKQAPVDPLGHGVITNNDYSGNVTHQIWVKDVTYHTNYHNPDNAKTFQEVTTQYDERHRPVARTVWLVARGVVDENDPPIAGQGGVSAADGLTTTWTYDDDLDDDDGLDDDFSTHLTSLSLGTDCDGSAVLVTNPEGERTLSIKDGLGRTVRTLQMNSSDAMMTQSTTTYDAVVNISGFGDVVQTSVANALGDTTKTRTDGAGRAIQTLDAEDEITDYTYDANSNLVEIRDPNDVGQDCEFDDLNRRVACTDTEDDETETEFDKQGNILKQIDAKDEETVMVYDARNRRTKLTDRLAGETEWSYDDNSNLLSLTDAEDETTTYTYDDANRRLTEEYPDHEASSEIGGAGYGIVTLTLDEMGRVKEREDQQGDTCTYTRDLAGRITSRAYQGHSSGPLTGQSPTDTFTYDKASRMLTAVSGEYCNTVTFTYDDAGRVATEALTISGKTYTVTRTYNTASRLTKITYPDDTEVDRTYTDRGQLEEVDYETNLVASFVYDDGGRETSRTFGNDLVTTTTYQDDNLVATMSTTSVSGLNFTYSYDANKNKTAETITSPMNNYGFSTGATGYDDEDRLVTWNRTDGNKDQSWSLSLVGDWNSFTEESTTQNRTHGDAHELTDIDSNSLEYLCKEPAGEFCLAV